MPNRQIGPYHLDRPLGSGAMGDVYLARTTEPVGQLEIGTQVAVKLVRTTGRSARLDERFEREGRAGMRVRHPNVARTIGVGTTTGAGAVRYLAMEYVPGQTLKALRERMRRIPEALSRHVAREVARGLSAIHSAGVVHRDIKPSNLMITEDDVIKILDLGVAILPDDSARLTQTGGFVGTLQYAAPEQFDGTDWAPDPRSDLYALGATLFELTTGKSFLEERLRAPLQSGPEHLSAAYLIGLVESAVEAELSASGENAGLSRFFAEVLRKLLRPLPQDRFASAAEVAEVIHAAEDSSWYQALIADDQGDSRAFGRPICSNRDAPFSGREAELGSLERAYVEAESGRGAVVVVSGEAGIGKSRLLDELFQALAQRSEPTPRLLHAGFVPFGASAIGPFAEAVCEHLGTRRVRDRVIELLSDFPSLAARLGRLLVGDAGADAALPETREAFQTGYVRLLRALAADRPLVLLIEDLHFAGKSGRANFAAIAAGVRDSQILVIGTTRPTLPFEWTSAVSGFGHLAWMDVPRVEARGLAGICRAAWPAAPPPASVTSRLVERADGNPFFLLELIRDLKHLPSLAGAEPRWSAVEVEARLGVVPRALRDIVRSRLDRLDRSDRELLQIASVIGPTFSPLVLARTVRRREDLDRAPFLGVNRQLGQIAADHGLVQAIGDAFRFEHHVAHEVLYGELPRGLRTAYHAIVGMVLKELAEGVEDSFVAPVVPTADEIARHLLEGDLVEAAVPYLDQALTRLGQRFEHRAAAELIEAFFARADVRSLPDGPTWLLRRVRIYRDAGQLGEALERVEEAIGILSAERPETQAEAHALLADALLHARRFEAALAAADRASELAERAGGPERIAQARVTRGTVLLHMGELDAAREAFSSVLPLRAQIDDPILEVRVLGNLALMARSPREVEDGVRYLRRCADRMEEIGDTVMLTKVLGNLAYLLERQSDMTGAHDCALRHLEFARQIGDRVEEGVALGNLAVFTKHLGDLARCRELLLESRVRAEEAADLLGVRAADVNIASIDAWCGDLDSAEAHIARVASSLSTETDARLLSVFHRYRAMILDRRGRRTEAIAELELAVERAVDEEEAAKAHATLGWLRLASGAEADAIKDLEAAVAISDQGDFPGSALLAGAYLATHDPDRVGVLLARYRRERRRLSTLRTAEIGWRLFEVAGDVEALTDAQQAIQTVLDNLDGARRRSALDANPTWKQTLAQTLPAP